MPNISDVAKLARVSTATVSRTLSTPDKVGMETRQRVLKAVSALGYSPNASARSLRTSTTGKLLVTVPYISNVFFSLIIQGIEEAAQRDGYTVVLGGTRWDSKLEDRYAEMLLRREVDGLIFLGHTISKSLHSLIKRGPMAPIVNGCEDGRRLGVPSARVDNEAAAFEAMNHLYALGHKHVAIVTGPLLSPLSRDRLRGAQLCAKEHAKSKQVTVVNGDFSIVSGVEAAARLTALSKPPTAIFCCNDAMAIGALEYLNRVGISVPEDMSVMGFDDIRYSRSVRPALTTISQPMSDIGHETVRLLLGVLRGIVTTPVSIILPHKLVIRSSTAAPPRAAGKR